MFFKRVFVLILMLFSSVSLAFTPTQAQIEQFKKLPRAQQEALAKQYGVDVSAFSSSSNASLKTNSEQQQSVQPRELDVMRNDKETVSFEKVLKPFGYELFSGQPSTFAPSEAPVVPNDYVIGNGDTITINLYGKTSAVHDVMVDGEGRLSIPDFSPVQVAGLTYSELKKLVEQKVSKEAIGLNVFISISGMRSLRVMVLGEVYKPGSYTVSPLSTITHALFASGGLSEIASLRNVQLKRQGKTVTNLDLYDLLLDGNAENDISLKNGDIIFVPSVGEQISVEGAVKREGIFELSDTDTKQSIEKMFGGFKEKAYKKQVQLHRVDDSYRSLAINVDFSKSNDSFKPQGGDRFIVQEVSERVLDSVKVIGAVVRPGVYEWSDGLTFDKVIKRLESDLLPQADYRYALILRETLNNGKLEVVQFSPFEALGSGNLYLKKNDEVFIFSRYNSKKNEEQALTELALTEDELKQQYQSKLWHLFEYHEIKKHLDEANKYTSNVLDSEFAPFSRKVLLEFVKRRLQTRSGLRFGALSYEVSGEVRFPGIYPISKSVTVSDAIIAAGGLLESAFESKAELTRFINTEEEQFKYIHLNLNNEQHLKQSIVDNDNLNILMQPNWQTGNKVTLKGEVKFPGAYTVSKGENLNSVIKRAGGLTVYAEPNAAVFTREAIKIQEQKQLEKLSEELRRNIASMSLQRTSGFSAQMSYEETNRLLSDLSSVEVVGRLVIDLPDVLEKRENVILQDGDTLYIPGKQDSISVIGEVNYASSHLFKSGITIDKYLEMSGGLKERANKEQIYVIKANGSVFIPQSSGWFSVNYQGQLQAGDTIVVPMDATYMDNLTLWNTATQIFFQLTAGIAAITRL